MSPQRCLKAKKIGVAAFEIHTFERSDMYSFIFKVNFETGRLSSINVAENIVFLRQKRFLDTIFQFPNTSTQQNYFLTVKIKFGLYDYLCS